MIGKGVLIMAVFLVGFDCNDGIESGVSFFSLSFWLWLLTWHDGFVASRTRKYLGWFESFYGWDLGERERERERRLNLP